jgi:hypothetical protein
MHCKRGHKRTLIDHGFPISLSNAYGDGYLPAQEAGFDRASPISCLPDTSFRENSVCRSVLVLEQ